jgi:2-C-methyl-D-erythritol 4-phosphate cytidylyltransferase/2-C-methyl-D-erythritol 2,4-cyclodiphosphate synthase
MLTDSERFAFTTRRHHAFASTGNAVARLKRRGGMLAHVDITLVAEAPKIGPHREVMRETVAAICEISKDRVGVKATTNEKLGFVGRREGIAAMASATVRLPLHACEP